MVVFFFCLVVGLSARAVQLQIISRDFLKGQGDVRHIRTVEVPANRGMITDRDGNPFAISTPVYSVWVDPVVLLENSEFIAPLAKALNIAALSLRKKLDQKSDKRFLYLQRKVRPEISQAIKNLDVPGVGLEREYKRFYPDGEVIGQITGFTGVDSRGQEGLELVFDEWLTGKPGKKKVLKDLYGRSVENVENIKSPQSGNDLVLTIDRRIQFLAYRELKKAVVKHKARAGTAVVIDCKRGEILAMVNQPSFNPNNRSGFKTAGIRNRAIADRFEPGSTVKPITIAAALDLEIINPHTVFETSPGYMMVGSKTLKDTRNYGKIDVTTILQKSSNIGTAKIALSMEPDYFLSVMSKAGFGQESGLSLPGETSGYLGNKSRWSDIERVTMAFGYGVSASVLQLAQAYTAFANEGVMQPVSLVKENEKRQGKKVFTKKTAKQVLEMMEKVVAKGGTAPLAAITNYRVAGKTGTSKKSIAGGYADDRYAALFAGIVPASDPRFVMVVVIDEPSAGEFYGGKVAAPVFSSVMTGVLRLLNVPPDDWHNKNNREIGSGRKIESDREIESSTKVEGNREV